MDIFENNEIVKKSKRSFAARKALGYGKNFESFISAACDYYRDKGLADIVKVDEPFMVLELYDRGRFKGQFTKKANPDFEGTLKGGHSICFEAKYTSQKRMAKSVISDKQEEVLSYKSVLGAVVGVCVGIIDRYFFVPWEVWANMEEIYGKKSVNADDLAKFEVKFRHGIMFLDRLGKDKQVQVQEVRGVRIKTKIEFYFNEHIEKQMRDFNINADKVKDYESDKDKYHKMMIKEIEKSIKSVLEREGYAFVEDFKAEVVEE